MQHRLPILFLVLNNGGYVVLKSSSEFLEQTYQSVPGLNVPCVNFVQLAGGFGCPAERIEKLGDFGSALDRAFSSDGPMLIDLAMDPTVQYMLSYAG